MYPAVTKASVDVKAQFAIAMKDAPPVLPLRTTIIHSNLTAGELALALSHRNIYDAVLMNRLPCALVLESDAAFIDGFGERLRAMALPARFDVLKLEGCNGESAAHPAEASANATAPPFRAARGQGGWCSAAYLLSWQGARLLRALQTPVWLQSDGAFRALDPLNNRQLDAALARMSSDPKWNATLTERFGGPLRAVRVFHTVPPMAWQRAGATERDKRRDEAGWDPSLWLRGRVPI